MRLTTADLTTVGQTFTVLSGKFKGRTLTVSGIGTTGRTLSARDTQGRVFLWRDATSITIHN